MLYNIFCLTFLKTESLLYLQEKLIFFSILNKNKSNILSDLCCLCIRYLTGMGYVHICHTPVIFFIIVDSFLAKFSLCPFSFPVNCTEGEAEESSSSKTITS